MTKQEKIKIIVLGIIWAIYFVFISVIGVMSTSSPNTSSSVFFITSGVLILLPLIVIIISRLVKRFKAKEKIFKDVRDFGMFVSPFLTGAVFAFLYLLLTFLL